MKDFVLPKYQDDCFANIPATIFKLLGLKTDKPTVSEKYFSKYLSKKYKNIILFLIDGLGFYNWQKQAKKISLFKKISQQKAIHPITAVFPSTTCAALNTIHSGLTPAEHGLFEWTLYMPKIDQTIFTLPFSSIQKSCQDSLKDKNIDPKILLNSKTIYERLLIKQINSSFFIDRIYAKSVYTNLSTKGSRIVSFVNFSDLVVKLRNIISGISFRSLYFVYWDKLDTLAHQYGPSSEAYQIELRKISCLFEQEFIQKLDKKTRQETLLLITADHGQIDVDPNQTIYLDQDKFIMDKLKLDKQGRTILPVGSARDVFLHVKKSQIDKLYKYLKDKFKNKAEILTVDKAIQSNLFGRKKVKLGYKARLGDLLILPDKNFTFWREYNGYKFTNYGHHGGLSQQEMTIPFVLIDLTNF